MARSFNGTSDLIKATGGASYGGTRSAYSIALWVSGTSQTSKAFQVDAHNSNKGFCFLGTDTTGGTKCRVSISDSSTGSTLLDSTSTAVILDSSWHHVCFTLDASGNWVLYIDGASDHSGGPLTSDTVSESWAAFGLLARDTNSAFFAGTLAQAANWTRVLAASEVAELANGLLPSHLGPAHYWPLWGVDSPEPDIGTGTHATGTLTGTGAAAGGKVGLGLLPVKDFEVSAR
jgi:hypothetical protein